MNKYLKILIYIIIILTLSAIITFFLIKLIYIDDYKNNTMQSSNNRKWHIKI